jgi:hypothetical protein
MKFNADKHVETLDNDYGTKPKKVLKEIFNEVQTKENEYEIPEEFKYFTNKVEKHERSAQQPKEEFGKDSPFSSTQR